MKNLFKILFLLVAITTTAQQEVNTTFASQMATLFRPLNKDKVPNGILLDIAMEFTNVPAYNGTLTDSTFVTPKSLKEIYNTLLMGRVRNEPAGIVSSQAFEDNWYAERSENHIALCGLYFKYSRFVPNAYTAGKLTYSNGMIYDKFNNGVWQNPYEELKTFAMTSPITAYTGLNLKVKLPQSLFYSNSTNEIQKIEIDFEDGLGYRPAVYNQLLNLNYAVEGNKTWKYKLTLTNGQTLLSASKIVIKAGINFTPITEAQANARTANTACGFYNFDITSTNLFNGLPGKARIFVDDAGKDCKITKPLILVEGWDVFTLLSPETKYTSADFKNFFESVKNGGNLSTLLNGDNNILHDQQYDLIFINWDNGVDFIQRNALVLEEVIKWVNAVKEGNEKLVVMGQSMGGVVARYCLRDMEQRGLTHNVRLFVSDDSPQQGANIPLSIQYLYRNVQNTVVQTPAYQIYNLASQTSQGYLFQFDNPAAKLFSILDQPATAQMLINRVNRNYQIDNSIHDAFYAQLKAKGYPQQNGIRNIAISNGSECGSLQNFNAGDVLVSYQGEKKLSFIENIIMPAIGVVGTVLIDPTSFLQITALSLFPGGSKFESFLEDRALYPTGGNKVHDFNISYTKWVLGIWPQKVYILDRQLYQPSSFNKHYDNYGGCFIDVAAYAGGAKLNGLSMRDKFGFIPTSSALGIEATTDADFKRPYIGAQPPVAPLNTPFANFTTAFKAATNPNKNNEKHLEFNARNGNWLASELNGLPENNNCSFLCDAEISGPKVMCSPSVYSAPAGGYSYNWYVLSGNNLIRLSNSNSQSTTITPVAGSNGSVLIRVVISGISTTANAYVQSCGYIDKNIWIGKPMINIVSNAYNIPGAVEFHLNGSNNSDISSQGISNVSYEKVDDNPSNCGIVSGYGFEGRIDYSGYNCSTQLKVTATNNCGYVVLNKTIVGHYSKSSAMKISNHLLFQIYPNPSNDIVYIETGVENNLSKNGSIITGELFDLLGRSKSKVELTNNKATFSVKGLNQGIYVLKIYINGEVESHQIAVE